MSGGGGHVKVIGPIDGDARISSGAGTDVVLISGARSIVVGDHNVMQVNHRYTLTHAYVTADGIRAIQEAYVEWARARSGQHEVGPGEAEDFGERLRDKMRNHRMPQTKLRHHAIEYSGNPAMEIAGAQGVVVGNHGDITSTHYATVDRSNVNLGDLAMRDRQLWKDLFTALRRTQGRGPAVERAVHASLDRCGPGERVANLAAHGGLHSGWGSGISVHGPASSMVGRGNRVNASIPSAWVVRVHADLPAGGPQPLRTLGPRGPKDLDGAVARAVPGDDDLWKFLRREFDRVGRFMDVRGRVDAEAWRQCTRWLDNRIDEALTKTAKRLGLPSTYFARRQASVPGWDGRQLRTIRAGVAKSRKRTIEEVRERAHKLVQDRAVRPIQSHDDPGSPRPPSGYTRWIAGMFTSRRLTEDPPARLRFDEPVSRPSGAALRDPGRPGPTRDAAPPPTVEPVAVPVAEPHRPVSPESSTPDHIDLRLKPPTMPTPANDLAAAIGFPADLDKPSAAAPVTDRHTADPAELASFDELRPADNDVTPDGIDGPTGRPSLRLRHTEAFAEPGASLVDRDNEIDPPSLLTQPASERFERELRAIPDIAGPDDEVRPFPPAPSTPDDLTSKRTYPPAPTIDFDLW